MFLKVFKYPLLATDSAQSLFWLQRLIQIIPFFHLLILKKKKKIGSNIWDYFFTVLVKSLLNVLCVTGVCERLSGTEPLIKPQRQFLHLHVFVRKKTSMIWQASSFPLFQSSCWAKLSSCWRLLHISSTDARFWSNISTNSWQEIEKNLFPQMSNHSFNNISYLWVNHYAFWHPLESIRKTPTLVRLKLYWHSHFSTSLIFLTSWFIIFQHHNSLSFLLNCLTHSFAQIICMAYLNSFVFWHMLQIHKPDCILTAWMILQQVFVTVRTSSLFSSLIPAPLAFGRVAASTCSSSSFSKRLGTSPVFRMLLISSKNSSTTIYNRKDKVESRIGCAIEKSTGNEYL